MFSAFNADNLKMPGIKFRPKDNSNDIPKLIKVSLIRGIWVLLYTAQKQDK